MRRLGLGMSALLIAATPAMAANKLGDARAAFPMLANYLKLPPAERSRFAPTYAFKVAGQPLTAPVWMILDGQRAPFPLDAAGRAVRLPTAAELDHGKLEIGVDAAAKIQISLGIEPTMAPAADLNAHDLALAIAQAAAGSKKAAGLLALAVPHLNDVAFVGAGSGEIEFADGHKASLPIVKGQPTYTPSVQPNARRIHLAKVPAKLDID